MTGRRKKVLKNRQGPESNFSDFDRNRIRKIFAQHLKNISMEDKDVRKLDRNEDDTRNKRSNDENQETKCQNAKEVLLKNDVISQSLLAASVLWGYWERNITEVTITPSVFHKILKELEQINTFLGQIGPWSGLFGKQATNWISSFIYENILMLPGLRM